MTREVFFKAEPESYLTVFFNSGDPLNYNSILSL